VCAQEKIVAWMTLGQFQREELERLFVEFGGYGGAVLRDDGEIHVYGSVQCACGDEMASDQELRAFVTFVQQREKKQG